jgi:hypothetical protein
MLTRRAWLKGTLASGLAFATARGASPIETPLAKLVSACHSLSIGSIDAAAWVTECRSIGTTRYADLVPPAASLGMERGTRPRIEIAPVEADSTRVSPVRVRLPAGCALPLHDHHDSAACVVLLEGRVRAAYYRVTAHAASHVTVQYVGNELLHAGTVSFIHSALGSDCHAFVAETDAMLLDVLINTNKGDWSFRSHALDTCKIGHLGRGLIVAPITRWGSDGETGHCINSILAP